MPSEKGGENWWGYCGNCKGEVDRRCRAGAGGYKVLRESWRALKGCLIYHVFYMGLVTIHCIVDGSVSGGKKDDSKLPRGWYKFEVPGAKNVPPSYNPGIQNA